MPSRKDVENWKPEKLSEWATELDAKTTSYEGQLDRSVTHFRGTNWQGKAYLAAYDRFGEEHDEGYKLSQEIRDVSSALRTADSRLADERRILLGRVSDAEHDGECPVGLTVDDGWKVHAKPYTGNSDQDKKKIKERIDHHQGLIDTARSGLMTAVGEVIAGIVNASNNVRTRGDQLGSGIDTPALTKVDPAELGRKDGEDVSDGKLSDKKIAQIADRLAGTSLPPDQLAILAKGGEITVPQSTMDYLSAFYDKAGRDGLVELSDSLKANGSPQALQLRQELINNMLTLSNEKVVTRGPDGQVADRGGWNKLNSEVREMIGTRPKIGGAPDSNTRDLPDDYRAVIFGKGPIDDRHALFDYTEDMAKMGRFLNSGDPSYVPGQRLGVELERQAAHQAWILDHGGYAGYKSVGMNEPDWSTDTEHSSQDLLSVGARNHEATYALLTGHGSDELFGKGVPGQSFEHYDPKVVNSLFQHEKWDDGGKAVGSLVDWIGTDSHDVGPDGKPTVQALHARESLTRLPGIFAPLEAPQDPAHHGDQPQLHRSGGLDEAQFGRTAKAFANNPELARSLAYAMGSNIDAYVDAPNLPKTAYLPEVGEAQLQVTDANRLLFLASQSDQGRLTLEVARQSYESNVLNQAFSQHDVLPGEYAKTSLQQLASLDGRYTNAEQNALTYQDEHKIHEYNNKMQEIFEKKKAAAEIVAKLGQSSLEFTPGGDASSKVSDVLGDKATDTLISKFIPEPQKIETLYPNASQINNQGYRNFQQELINTAYDHGSRLPDNLIDGHTGRPIDLENSPTSDQTKALRMFAKDQGFEQFITDYNQTFGIEVLQGVGQYGTSLSVILTGKEK
ncbi:hypothetical protein VMT65_35175 [Nocardia sp. CDC153]|uniref:TPR repeat region-containing protein n=1 Tax=Nocardia sp. CDC153 TaxID=3112167 RepID=UPI002DB863F5|nr:hypothetical protein [Nocardia sp. CDC153]MEC3958320.1 hypothetical protein [Nocardia sp. CDC153]